METAWSGFIVHNDGNSVVNTGALSLKNGGYDEVDLSFVRSKSMLTSFP